MHPPSFSSFRRLTRALAPTAVLFLLVACSTTGAPGGAAPGPAEAAVSIRSPVVGYWKIGQANSRSTMAQFSPAGNVRVMCANKARISGNYTVVGDQLTIISAGHDQPTTYRYRVGDDGLTYEPVAGAPAPAWMGRAGVAWRQAD